MSSFERTHEDEYRAAPRRHLWIAFWLIVSFIGVEVVSSLLANSLALLADAGHMVTDAFAIGLALIAIWIASRPPSARMTFGFQRVEIIAASLNAVSLWVIAGWIFFDASRRFGAVPEVQGPLTLSVGAIGLGVNLAALLVLNPSRDESLNVRGAFLHVLGDAIGSAGVIAAGVLIIAFGWYIADPVIAVFIGAIILISSLRLAWETGRILMQGAPRGLNLGDLCTELEKTDGVMSIHDIHVWSVTSGYEVLTAHAELSAGTDQERTVLESLRRTARDRFGIRHVTIQIDRPEDNCVERHHAVHL